MSTGEYLTALLLKLGAMPVRVLHATKSERGYFGG